MSSESRIWEIRPFGSMRGGRELVIGLWPFSPTAPAYSTQAKAEAAGENSAVCTVCGGGESPSGVGAIKSSAPFQWRQRPELHRFIRTARYQVRSFGELHKLQPPHVTLMTAEGMESGAPRSSIPNLDRAICAA